MVYYFSRNFLLYESTDKEFNVFNRYYDRWCAGLSSNLTMFLLGTAGDEVIECFTIV